MDPILDASRGTATGEVLARLAGGAVVGRWFFGGAYAGAGVDSAGAALLSALMIFLWVLLLHLPRAVGMKSAGELDGVFEALAISGIALLLAGTARPVFRRVVGGGTILSA